MTATTPDRQRAERIETLVQAIADLPDSQMRAQMEELVQELLALYGDGLARIMELAAEASPASDPLIETLANDSLVGSLLLLHGLHPVDLTTRIAHALDGVRPYLASHGGNVELLGVEGAVAHLRLEGSCHGCPSSTVTLKLAIEDAIYAAAPELERLEVEGVVEPPPRLITVAPARRRASAAAPNEQEGVWSTVEGVTSLAPNTLRLVTVRGQELVLCQVADTSFAYQNHCGACGAPLDGGTLAGAVLTCPACGRGFDICRAGRCVDGPDLFLEPVPLLAEGGALRVALQESGERAEAGAVSTR